ncbi:MBL fold metallo-hydrolase [Acinetobacter sp. ANC 4173]|uniref:MBL fold metallo-hydrolase n=1 Tax=Acinetobacter sp. ANC 4173 TaxID=2529837 RepID=UPI00103C3BF0|nr:MBL fold metallo-hydrolase [Acinetobacter sp. ANC 4173]TCB81815.1 MBL fold metallo-hydrolase [Acinetobacter sp. ANC 4173]
MIKPIVKAFFDKETNTFSYVVTDPNSRQSAIIDSVLNYDAASATTKTTLADEMISYIQQNSLSVIWILETHVHADHLTASQYLKQKVGGVVAISEKIAIVQETFSTIYNLAPKYFNATRSFDYLFKDGEHFKIGEIDAYNIPTPGHTPACLSYVIGDAVFVGDTLFMPDYGTARCDFPKGSAAILFDSVQKLFALDNNMRVFLCHDYLPEGRDHFVYETSIAEQKIHNIHINESIKKEAFVNMRNQRDATLAMPKLILPAIQINMQAGKFPEPEENGISYLKIPFNFFKSNV